jgi:SEC-C motif-containing protein
MSTISETAPPTSPIAPDAPCPCGAGGTYAACCQPLHAGTRQAATALELMRARYCAYVAHQVDFIARSDHPGRHGDFDRAAAMNWAVHSTWQGCDIVATTGGGVDDQEGTVEFAARFTLRGKPQVHREVARFVRVDGRWVYEDGQAPAQVPFVKDQVLPGRNDPCHCGSGKKFKKCHGA